ncbi:MAG TPA: transcriptional regulator GcvA [Stellaceae bacterium]|jgi:DNA-binding transcriptional LysR family regulator|nr:transcriptional regulator GcvA [Stellaceae bacterium]
MPKRYNLPPLGFFQGFEAAARTLSFTKAAEELFITQSAVSRQIKALEDHLGIRLFERRPRSLALTESGQALYRMSADVLERLQTATDQLRAASRTRQLALTTTTGFASLWLIPRLQRFTGLHPDIDVRISATTDPLNLERSLLDLAIRYCLPEAVPDGAVRLFGEEMIPVCAPALLRDRARPLKRPQDLQHHVLLHFDYPGAHRMFMDWGTWLTPLGIGEIKSAGALHFSQYEQMIQAAIAGQGVALGRQPLVNDLIQSGMLAAPFKQSVVGSRGYFVIESPLAAGKPHVRQFAAWLLDEVRRDAERDGHG